jgi:hypothetical protein
MIHSKFCRPRIFSWASARAPEQIDRVQNFAVDYSANREKQYELGTEPIIGFKQNRPSATYTMRQFEFGNMDLWYDLSNKENPVSNGQVHITLDDIKIKRTDVAMFMTDDSGNFTGTTYVPKLRLGSFSINIADTQAIVERNFNFVGEHDIFLPDNYLAYATATSGVIGTVSIVLSPIAIEYALGEYILKVLRDRAGQVTELLPAEYTYTVGTATVAVLNCVVGDIIKVFYESATPYDTIWTQNVVDEPFLEAKSCEILMKVGTSQQIHLLQSVGIDGTFERTDYGEIDTDEIIQTGVKSQTVTVSLDRYAEGWSLEKILASDTLYPYFNPDDFQDNIQLMVKIYSDKSHTTFKIGYLIKNLAPMNLGQTQAVQDYQKRTNKLEADNLLISTLEADIAFA